MERVGLGVQVSGSMKRLIHLGVTTGSNEVAKWGDGVAYEAEQMVLG